MTPTVNIYQLVLENDLGVYRREYFFTKRGLSRYLKKHNKELEQSEVTWYWCEHLLWLW